MSAVFSMLTEVALPEALTCDRVTGRSPEFLIQFAADGVIPFPQVLIWEGSRAHLFRPDTLTEIGEHEYELRVPAGRLGPGTYCVQIEGCQRADITRASAGEWIKRFAQLTVHHAAPAVAGSSAGHGPVKLYFGIHKHLHQPFYDSTNLAAWDGEKEEIFGSRHGPYTSLLPAAVRQYIEGGLPHAGLSTSWSGTLVEQLERCAAEGLCDGRFAGWSGELRALAREKTALGHPRLGFAAFGYHHPLMALIPERDIIRSIELHRGIIERVFGVATTRVLFPPETAFHVRMIPALRRAGIEVVIYDSIHRFRACRDYPYAGPREGMLPPNPAEQVNPPVTDWLQLHNIWAGSLISPSLLRPEVVRYEEPSGAEHTIVAVPAERYIGNEDARGGFGALQYPSVLGQVYDRMVADGSFDPAHPPFFVLHSDGDNHGGGADSYYRHNTGSLVEWIRGDPRFELTTIDDYLERFPPDASNPVHLEPGAWSGADNGDPQFRKWFSRYEQPYSPDLNSWAVLTALQNLVHALADAQLTSEEFPAIEQLLLRAETSCYWYWTGQEVWDRQVTAAANLAWELARSMSETLPSHDRTGPTIFPPWVNPENPGGKTWGSGGLVDAPRTGRVHSLVYDVSGLSEVVLVLRPATGERRIAMDDRGPYPSQTGARVVARLFTADLPVGAGDVRYYIEARDGRGNVTLGSLERVHLA